MSAVVPGLVWTLWRIGVPLLLAVLFVHATRAEPVPARTGKTGGSAKRARPHHPIAGVGYVVRPGDTLWSIARRHGTSVDALARRNGLELHGSLAIGQQLTIPGRPVEKDRQEPPSLAEIVLGPPPASNRVALGWPVSAPVVSPFGPRRSSWHGGIDLGAARGTAIRAAAAGMIIASGWEGSYGNVIKIWHVADLMTVYGHNHENYVRVGDWVERAQVIGTVGSTGRTTAPHLHFEVRLDGRKYDPLFWLPDPSTVDVASSSGERSTRER